MRSLVLADRPTDKPLSELIREVEPEVILTLGDLQEWFLAPVAQFSIPVMGVYGNHCTEYFESLGITNLHLRAYQYGGMIFGGFEGSNRYKAHGHHQWTQQEAWQMIRVLPRVDVMVCHSPPYGVNDHQDDAHQGFYALNWYIKQYQPKYLLHGHTYPDNPMEWVEQTRIVYVHGHAVVDL